MIYLTITEGYNMCYHMFLCVVQIHVYTEEKPFYAGPFDGYFMRCQVTETEPHVDGTSVCSFACGDNRRGFDSFTVRVFGRYGPVRSLCEVELIVN